MGDYVCFITFRVYWINDNTILKFNRIRTCRSRIKILKLWRLTLKNCDPSLDLKHYRNFKLAWIYLKSSKTEISYIWRLPLWRSLRTTSSKTFARENMIFSLIKWVFYLIFDTHLISENITFSLLAWFFELSHLMDLNLERQLPWELAQGGVSATNAEWHVWSVHLGRDWTETSGLIWVLIRM